MGLRWPVPSMRPRAPCFYPLIQGFPHTASRYRARFPNQKMGRNQVCCFHTHTHHNKSRAHMSLLERAMEGEICRCYDMLQYLQYILAWFGCAFRFDNARAISLDELPTRQSPGAILQGLGLWESLFPDKWGGIWRTGDWRGRALTTWCEWMRTRHCNGLLPFVTIKSYNIHMLRIWAADACAPRSDAGQSCCLFWMEDEYKQHCVRSNSSKSGGLCH